MKRPARLIKLLTEILHIRFVPRCLPCFPLFFFFSSPFLSPFPRFISKLIAGWNTVRDILSTRTILHSPRNWYRYLRVTALLYVFAGNISGKLQFESRCRVLKSIAPTSWLCPFFFFFSPLPLIHHARAYPSRVSILRWWSNYDKNYAPCLSPSDSDNYRKFFKKDSGEEVERRGGRIDTRKLILDATRLWWIVGVQLQLGEGGDTCANCETVEGGATLVNANTDISMQRK